MIKEPYLVKKYEVVEQRWYGFIYDQDKFLDSIKESTEERLDHAFNVWLVKYMFGNHLGGEAFIILGAVAVIAGVLIFLMGFGIAHL